MSARGSIPRAQIRLTNPNLLLKILEVIVQHRLQIFQLRYRKVSLDGYHIFGDICYIAIAFGTSRLVIQLIVMHSTFFMGDLQNNGRNAKGTTNRK